MYVRSGYGKQPQQGPIYERLPPELRALQQCLDLMIARGMIGPSTSIAVVPIVMMYLKLRMVVIPFTVILVAYLHDVDYTGRRDVP